MHFSTEREREHMLIMTVSFVCVSLSPADSRIMVKVRLNLSGPKCDTCPCGVLVMTECEKA